LNPNYPKRNVLVCLSMMVKNNNYEIDALSLNSIIPSYKKN